MLDEAAEKEVAQIAGPVGCAYDRYAARVEYSIQLCDNVHHVSLIEVP
jgi:hypothetical protein